MKRITVFLLFVGVILTASDAFADSYSVQFVEIGNDGNNLDVRVQIKANGTAFKLGTTNLAFSFGSGLNAPVLQTSHNFGDGATYAPLNVTTLPGNISSLNIEYLGSLDSGATVPVRFIDIATIRFPIANANGSFLLMNRTSGGIPRSVVFTSNENEVMGQSTNIRAAVKVMLEGPFNVSTGTMRKNLKSDGHLATRYPGVSIPNEAVDSISIEVRNASSAAASTIRMFRSAWLLTDGSIRDFADTTQRFVDFDTTDASFYLVVRHMNHLGVMSVNAQPMNALGHLPYNFCTGQSQAWGTNPMKALQTGVFGLYAGDGNRTGIVTFADRIGILSSLNASGYSAYDINLTGITTIADGSFVILNVNKSTQVPE